MKKYSHKYRLVASLLIFSVLPTAMTSCGNDGDEPQPENPTGFRPAKPDSSPYAETVFEYTPAPGQFINEESTGTWDDNITAEDAARWARSRLEKQYFVSLGAFGGYIIVGFDHSIPKTGKYEIGIFGNAFMSPSGSSNEAGIVYVMQDSNRNGIPDDTWYELQGSDTFSENTIRDYAVTYFKPATEGKPVRWTDNMGNSGEISYLGLYHSQPSYYPVWIKTDQYTLKGTKLESKTNKDPETGLWSNPPFEWGYADNCGEDSMEFDGKRNCNRFRISDAIDERGNPVNLEYIDFVKVQTGINASAGWLGEVSTEVLGFVDLTLF